MCACVRPCMCACVYMCMCALVCVCVPVHRAENLAVELEVLRADDKRVRNNNVHLRNEVQERMAVCMCVCVRGRVWACACVHGRMYAWACVWTWVCVPPYAHGYVECPASAHSTRGMLT